MGQEQTAKFTVSILAEKVAFSISEYNYVGNERGFLIVLDEIYQNSGRKYVSLKFCPKISQDLTPDVCHNSIWTVHKTVF